MADQLQVGSQVEGYEIRGAIRRDSVVIEYEGARRGSDRAVIVREFFPDGVVERVDGVAVSAIHSMDQALLDGRLMQFLGQYRILRQLNHPAFNAVLDCIRANGTGYVFLENPEGEILATRLAGAATLTAPELDALIHPLVDGLDRAHRANLLHRAITPESIVLQPGGHAVLTGFGSAPNIVAGPRQAFTQRDPASVGHLSAGYAALEQYSSRGQVGPWTDIYAFGAVLYRCVTGATPADAPGRAIHDDLVPAERAAGRKYDPKVLRGIDSALALRVAERPRNLSAWSVSRIGSTARGAASSAPKQRMAARHGARAARVPSSDASSPNWTLPAIAATALIVVLTWVDTGILRTSEPEPGVAEELGEVGMRSEGGVDAVWARRAAAGEAAKPAEPADEVTGSPAGIGRPARSTVLVSPDEHETPAVELLATGADGEPVRAAPPVDTARQTKDIGVPAAVQPTPNLALAQPSTIDVDTTRRAMPDGSDPENRPQSFEIGGVPDGTQIEFVGDVPSYVPGMLLPAGRYEVSVSSPGYKLWRGTIVHGATPTIAVVALEKVEREYADALASGGVGPLMIRIPPGTFHMGCVSGIRCFSNELPVLDVEIESGFAMSVYETTLSEYDRFTDATERARAVHGAGGERGKLPVVNVSWSDAMAYTAWLAAETGHAYRLPTEAEWEYAARAGSVAAYSWGNGLGGTGRDCAGCGGGGDSRGPLPVGSFLANVWGLRDMHGNVWGVGIELP